MRPITLLSRRVKSSAKEILVHLPPKRVTFGSLRRLQPVSNVFGFDRGKPIDRYYIESFLEGNADRIRGCVLEVGDDSYSRQFGGGKIVRQEVLHVVPGFPGATIIADLTNAPQIPSDIFDCAIITQTLQYIFDPFVAVSTLHRILKPGGTVLATVPGMSRILRDQVDKESDCWRFTQFSAQRLFRTLFADNVQVRTYGNVLAAVAYLEGLATCELQKSELDYHDPDFQVTIAVTATKEAKLAV